MAALGISAYAGGATWILASLRAGFPYPPYFFGPRTQRIDGRIHNNCMTKKSGYRYCIQKKTVGIYDYNCKLTIALDITE
jgi:hypothetical protein